MYCRRFVVFGLCLAIQLVTSTLWGAEGSFRIFWIDVEGGAATLIVTPAGESVLIDTGNPGLRDPNRIFKVATQDAGLKRIDHLITTHYHRDHFGGAALLATLLPIGTVYDNGKFDGMPDNPGKDYFEFPCEKRVVLNPGDRLKLKQQPNVPEVSIRCLGTRQQFIAASAEHPANETICAMCREKDRDGSDNANSIVSIVAFGDFRFFDGGDLTWNQETKLVCPQNLIGQVDVYQVTHHGLDTSNNPVVLQTIQPHVAIMNNGDQKGCLPEVFATLKATASIAAIYQVHKNLRGDGAENNVADEFIANHKPSAECDGHHIELEVAADSKSYEIRIPAHQHHRRFETTRKLN
jgi:beta-lactamase superfamily II metal-dependent hydrolase